MKTFALIGNQNSGKTTLFNALTGSNQRVGNFPGVTVDKKQGTIKGTMFTVVDLPGVYSLSPYTLEELVTKNFSLGSEADAFINIVDASNIQRNLYLTLQLAELGRPMVVALNMMDEVARHGDLLQADKLSQLLHLPVVPLCARTGEGVPTLIERSIGVLTTHALPKSIPLGSARLQSSLATLEALTAPAAVSKGLPPRYVATKLFEWDSVIRTDLALTPLEEQQVNLLLGEAQRHFGSDADAVLADARYRVIESVTEQCLIRRHPLGTPSLSNKIDDIVTHSVMAFPLFALLIILVFWITFGPLGTALSDGFALLLEHVMTSVKGILTQAALPPWLCALLIDGVLTGVGAVLNFLPVILLLFLCLSLLEDSGYMARAAYVFDRPLRKFGLSGRSVVPLIMGFGCTVPAVMSSRTMPQERDRRLTIWVTPFMSCGAKVPLYAMFAAAFFPAYRGLAFAALYLGGILAALCSAKILQKTAPFRAPPAPFLMELPPYRLPTPHTTLTLLAEKASDFLLRAFTTILAGTVLIWCLQHFGTAHGQNGHELHMVSNAGESLLARLGASLIWFFRPLGFGNWQSVTAILSGFTAKEAIVGTLAVVYEISAQSLPTLLAQQFTKASAVSFMVYTLLCPPCIAALTVIKRELGSWRLTLASIAYQTAAAWCVTFVVYRTALFITNFLL